MDVNQRWMISQDNAHIVLFDLLKSYDSIYGKYFNLCKKHAYQNHV